MNHHIIQITGNKENIVEQYKLKLLYFQLLNCKGCPLHSNRIKLVFGDIITNSPIVFVGEAPGYNENITGIPFIGRSGKFLRKMIKDSKLNKISSILNVVKCWPGDGNPDPDINCIKKCLPFLLEQIEIIQPKLIVAVGKIALATLLDKEKEKLLMGKYINKLNKGPYLDIPIFGIYHPRYSMMQPLVEYWQSFRTIHRIING